MDAFNKDLYEILGVKKEANDAEIRKAFLKAAKKLHPDVNPNNKEAEMKFKEVNLAYEVLKDAKKRAQYDQMRAAGANPFAGGNTQGQWRTQGGRPFSPEDLGDLGLGDLFQEIFGGNFGNAGFRGGGRAGGGRGRRSAGFAQRGNDRDINVTISFLEAARGGERILEMSDGRRLTVKIPEGVSTGSKIKLTGQGDPGANGGPGGDLILTMEVGPHPYFQREGQDVILRLPITFSEAVLGAEVDVPTLDGKVVMKIPRGVSSGQRLKLSGKGIRVSRDANRGDQFVEVQIKIPKETGPAYSEAAEKLKGESFNPREFVF